MQFTSLWELVLIRFGQRINKCTSSQQLSDIGRINVATGVTTLLLPPLSLNFYLTVYHRWLAFYHSILSHPPCCVHIVVISFSWHPKVGHLTPKVAGDKNISGGQISVDEVHSRQVFHRCSDTFRHYHQLLGIQTVLTFLDSAKEKWSNMMTETLRLKSVTSNLKIFFSLLDCQRVRGFMAGRGGGGSQRQRE